MIPLIYVAGPLAAATPLAVRRNVEAARDLGLKVAEAGAYPVIPHTNTGEFFGLLDEETLWRPGAMELLTRCDGIVLRAEWEASSGARAEFEWALTHDLPTLVYVDAGPYLREDRLRTFVHLLIDRGADRLSFDRMRRGGVTVLGKPE